MVILTVQNSQLRTMYFLLNLEPLVIATHFTAFLIRLAYGHRVNLSKSPILTSATFFFCQFLLENWSSLMRQEGNRS